MANKRAMNQARAKLTYSRDTYTPEGLKSLTERELRKEYSRLRSIARKRLERFVGTEWEDSQVYRLNVGIYIPLKDIKTERELRYLTVQVAHFLTASTGSVSGLNAQRERAVQTLNERGIDFVNKDNFKEFGEFMEYARIVRLNRMFDSERVAEFYEFAKKAELTGEELRKAFRRWSKRQDKQKRIQHRDPRNSDYYLNRED